MTHFHFCLVSNFLFLTKNLIRVVQLNQNRISILLIEMNSNLEDRKGLYHVIFQK